MKLWARNVRNNMDNLEKIIKLEKRKDELDKILNLMYVLVRFKISGGSIKTFFDRNEYNSIAVYGMGRLGEVLCDYLVQEGLGLLFCIDCNPDYVFYDIPVYHVDDVIPNADIVIVTVMDEKVKELLQQKKIGDAIMIEDFLKSLIVYR